VRPGDTLYVPESGNVTVVGWIYHPTVVPIAKGMTVLQAVSACGGPLFAADMTNIKVIRRVRGGPLQVIHVNLKDIENRATHDIPVNGNDVIDVTYDPWRIPGYAVYYAAQGMVTFVPAAAVTSGGI
jgi:protein involved in polysaccharide export with SLBB domain